MEFSAKVSECALAPSLRPEGFTDGVSEVWNFQLGMGEFTAAKVNLIGFFLDYSGVVQAVVCFSIENDYGMKQHQISNYS